MLWHIVKFRFAEETTDEERTSLEHALAGLADRIEQVRLLRVARSVDEADVSGLLSGFDDEAALATYRDHPEHLPVVARARELCEEITRLDIETDDPTDVLTRTG